MQYEADRNQTKDKHLELEEVKRKLSEIFTYYAQFGDRLNTTNLKSINFHKMLRDASIYDIDQTIEESAAQARQKPDMITKKRADLIFCSVNKNKVNMTFDVFLQALIKIGQAMYPSVSPSESLQKLVRTRMIPLHEAIISEQKYVMGPDGAVFELQHDELVSLVLRDVG